MRRWLANEVLAQAGAAQMTPVLPCACWVPLAPATHDVRHRTARMSAGPTVERYAPLAFQKSLAAQRVIYIAVRSPVRP